MTISLHHAEAARLIEAGLEAVLAKRGAHAFVVDRRVGVEPVRTGDRRSASAPWRASGRLSSSWRRGISPASRSSSVSFNWNRSAYCCAVEGRIRQQQLGRTALDDRPQQIGRREVVDGLRRQEHGGVPLAPRLQRLLHVGAQRLVLNEAPRFVHDAELQRAGGAGSAMRLPTRCRT